MENWKDIKGYEGCYQVSDLGRVTSLDRIDCTGGKRNGRILKQNPDGKGYLMVSLYLNGKQKTRKVHQLVSESFLNHKPYGMKVVIDHIDNDKQNNNLTNLQLITNRENSSKDRVGGTSRYVGVSFYKQRNKYVARCWYNGKTVFLGYFNTEKEASEVYNIFLKSIQ
jgi:hypothetical protein